MIYTNGGLMQCGAESLLSTLGIGRAYLIDATDPYFQLSGAEHSYVFSPSNKNVVAFTAPVADLMFKNGALRYSFMGRGFCCVFRKSPLQMSRSEKAGSLLHEIGHYFDFGNSSARDSDDHACAVKTAWANMRSEEQQHGPRWVRATVHAWARVAAASHDIDPADLHLDSPAYPGKGSTSQYVSALIGEAASRRGESIESIIASPAPVAFTKLF